MSKKEYWRLSSKRPKHGVLVFIRTYEGRIIIGYFDRYQEQWFRFDFEDNSPIKIANITIREWMPTGHMESYINDTIVWAENLLKKSKKSE